MEKETELAKQRKREFDLYTRQIQENNRVYRQKERTRKYQRAYNAQYRKVNRDWLNAPAFVKAEIREENEKMLNSPKRFLEFYKQVSHG